MFSALTLRIHPNTWGQSSYTPVNSFYWSNPSHTLKEFYFYLWNSLPASAWKTGWTLRTGVRSGLWEATQTDSYCQHKAVIFINFNLRLYTVSDSLSTPLWKEGEKASQKDEFQNRKITTLIMKPSQLKKEVLKVAKWKMSRFWGYMHNY